MNFPYTRKMDSEKWTHKKNVWYKKIQDQKKKWTSSREVAGNTRIAEMMCPRNFNANGYYVLKEYYGICVSECRMSAMKHIQHLVF